MTLPDTVQSSDTNGHTWIPADERALIARDRARFFPTAHCNDFSAVLILLDRVDLCQLRKVIIVARFCRAPRRIAGA